MLYLVLNLMYLYTFLYLFIFLFIVIYFNFNILESTSCNLVCINQLVLQSDLEKYVKCQPELVKSDKYNRTSPIHNVELYPKP